MAKLKDVLKGIAQKAGIAESNEFLTALLANESAANVDIDDSLADALNSQLISMDAAKNHPEIGKVYRSQTLDTIDKKLPDMLDVLGLDDSKKHEFLAEKSTFAKLDRLKELVKIAKESKASATGADKAEHQKIVDALNAELRAVKEQNSKDKEIFTATRRNDLKKFALTSKIKNYKTILDGTNESAKFVTCSNVIDSLLKEYGAELVPDDNGELILQTEKTGDKVYNKKTNTVLTTDQFLEMALEQNKLLKNSEPAKAAGAEPGGAPLTPPIGQNAANTDKTAQSVKNFNSKLKELVSNS